MIGWTLSQDGYTLHKVFYDATVSESVSVCDRYSNCSSVQYSHTNLLFDSEPEPKPDSDGGINVPDTGVSSINQSGLISPFPIIAVVVMICVGVVCFIKWYNKDHYIFDK